MFSSGLGDCASCGQEKEASLGEMKDSSWTQRHRGWTGG